MNRLLIVGMGIVFVTISIIQSLPFVALMLHWAGYKELSEQLLFLMLQIYTLGGAI